MEYFNLDIIGPKNQDSFMEVMSLQAKSLLGSVSILANHEPFIFYLLPGNITLEMKNGIKMVIQLSNSILTVSKKNYVIATEGFNKI